MALLHPEYGYYSCSNPLKAYQSDFITSPEISQIFGELVGVWIVHAILTNNLTYNKIYLIELGPGNGLLMQDILRVCKKYPEIYNKLCIILVEKSKELKKAQLKNIELPVVHIKHINDIELHNNNLNIILANEFLDALPIKQYIVRDHQLYENIITTNNQGELVFSPQAQPSKLKLPLQLQHKARDNAVYEYNIGMITYINNIKKIFKQHNTLGIFIDYGYTKYNFGSSLQGMHKHKYHNILENIGNVDITYHVNFQLLQQLLTDDNFYTSNITTQREFLLNLGIQQRMDMLIKSSPSKQAYIIKSTNYLINNMGELFKTLAFTNINK